MKRSWCALVAFACFLAVASPADADLVSVGAWEAGDGYITRDTEAGLDWLSLRVTNDVAVNEVIGGYLGLVAAGFRVADVGEVRTLANHVGFEVPESGRIQSAVLNELIVRFMGLLGCTQCPAQPGESYTQGAYAVGSLYDFGGFAISSTGIGSVSLSADQPAWNPNHHQRGTGVFLVRLSDDSNELLPGGTPARVPEPSSLLLLCTGFLIYNRCIGATRRSPHPL